jgi:hypothetical protein
MTKLALGAFVMFSVLLIACGGGGGGDDTAPAAAPPTPSAVDDAAYLAIMCAGLDAFSDAIDTATNVDAIAAVIEDFIAELQAVSPPADIAEFHEAFTNYLIEALDDPTSPLIVPPPLPDDDVRERLADLEDDVAACKSPTFFQPDE